MRCVGADLGTQSETFHNARPEPLHDDVGAPDQLSDAGHVVGVLDVGVDGASRPVQTGVGIRDTVGPGQIGAGPPDPDDVGAEIVEQHAGVRGRPESGHLDHPHAGEWSAHDVGRWWRTPPIVKST